VTIQAQTFNTSKKVLEQALNEAPQHCRFYDPSIFPGSRGQFRGDSIEKGEHFAVVMDHPKRMRFATVTRKPDGTFKVG
jgi:hypothetical protein